MKKEDRPPRFMADFMLGKLCRWLRLMGYDCEYWRGRGGEELLKEANSQGRILLTRNRALVRRRTIGPHLLVRSDHFPQQVEQLMTELGIDPEKRPLSRCPRCNSEIEPASAREAAERIPVFVRKSGLPLGRCPNCGRFYWPATHAGRIRKTLAALKGERE